jgi:gamma-glutamylcyclotransferase (GGCT)/AIG2-like uncharacterized protein YtfP
MYYFAYGSNLHKEQMKGRCPDSVPVAKVSLKDYQLVFNRVADIVEEKSALVPGALYTVSQADIENLDHYEGYPSLYDKVQVVAEDDQGKTYKAFAYVMTVKGRGEPGSRYYGIIEEGYKDWQLPLSLLQKALNQSR